MTVILEGNAGAVLRRIVPCFRHEHVRYVLIGAWALAVWGRPRATSDVDFLALLNEGRFETMIDRITQAGLTLDETWAKWNPMLRGSQLRFQFAGATVDLLCSRDVHDRQVFRRKRRKRMGGSYYWVGSPEDFILQKLKVGRPMILRMPCRSWNDAEKPWIEDICSDGPTASAYRQNFIAFFLCEPDFLP